MRSHVARRSCALALFVLIALIATSNDAARGQTDNQTQTGFFWPTGRDFKDDKPGWLADSCPQTGNDNYFTTPEPLYHIGWDIRAPLDSPVIPIADGIVYQVSEQTSTHDVGWGIGSEGLGNKGVLIEHVLDDDSRFLALYGHVRTNLERGHPVTGGIPFAKIGPWPYGTHLHFGIHPNTSAPVSNWGRQKCTNWPSTNGFVNPYEWITTKRPKTVGSVPAPPAPIPVPLFSGTAIDDSSAAFTKSGTPRFWQTAGGGNGGSFVWTRNNTTTPDNTGTWAVSVSEPGLYEVFVFIPPNHASTTNAVYEIRHSSKTDIIPIDQSQHHNQWRSLGTFDFAGNGAEYVRLTDTTGEPDGTKEIAFDAVGIIRREQGFLEKIWSDIQRLGRDIGQTIEKIQQEWDKLADPQKIIDQIVRELTDRLIQELLRELQKLIQGLCGSGLAIVALPALAILWWQRQRPRD